MEEATDIDPLTETAQGGDRDGESGGSDFGGRKRPAVREHRCRATYTRYEARWKLISHPPPLAKMIWDVDVLFSFGVGILLGRQADGF